MFSLTAREMAPLIPAFTALAGDWPIGVPPERILRSVLLMALCDVHTVEALSAKLAHDQVCRRFFGLSEGQLAPAPRALAAGQSRLIRNENARQVVRAIVERMRSAGVLAGAPFVENRRLVQAWTGEVRP